MHEPDEHRYISGHTVDDDPYVQPNGVLTNLLNLTSTADLNTAEAEFVPIRTIELWEQPVAGQFDLPHLQEIHRRLFQDIYPWAGQLRQVDIAKRDTYFMMHTLINVRADELFQDLAATGYLTGRGMDDFCEAAAIVLARVNFIHPFREGNGRAQREFIRQMAEAAGYEISWHGISQEAMTQASIEACRWNFRPFTRLLRGGIGHLSP